MTQISASQVNMLRKQTGAGMMDCKKALVETGGDFDQAIDVLRKKGQKVAAKRADRETTEGVVLGLVAEGKDCGAILSLNCETDFVAKNESFIALAKSFLTIALSNKSKDVESIKALSFDANMSIEEKLVEQTGVIGEKLALSNYHIISADFVSTYIHPGNKLVSLVGFHNMSDGSTENEVGKNIAMQIAAMNPVSLTESDVPQEVINKEIEIGKDLARQEGKPEEMLEKISMGRLKKFFKENTLTNQTFIKDSKKTVMQYLKECNDDWKIVEFKRVNLG
ncbi:MAG: elongation factor Ts [Flavobacteriales bacterium]|nr:elongation factor Ts [Flavobacteriales bacterium]|tara:strand:+ start:1412 stop:2251 length:840 start_codon:yes stop_codon:yes gene_type:complete